jgi:hypothetical protein
VNIQKIQTILSAITSKDMIVLPNDSGVGATILRQNSRVNTEGGETIISDIFI